MEELILIAAFGIMALIAMSQCAHHSSRRHEKLYLPPKQHDAADPVRAWGHAVVTSDNSNEPARGAGSDREPLPK